MAEPSAPEAQGASRRGQRRLKRRLDRGGRALRGDFRRLNGSIARASATDALTDRAQALRDLARVRSSQAALRKRLAAVEGAGTAGSRAVAAFDLFDRGFSEMGKFLRRGTTATGVKHARRAQALSARASATLRRAYEELD